MRLLPAVLLLVACPAIAWPQSDSAVPGRLAIRAFDGAPLGYVVMGVSRTGDVQRLLDTLGGLGPRRENKVTFTIGPHKLRPRQLYTPPATMNQLYFDHDVLVLLVEGTPHGLPTSCAEFLARFPEAKETHREAGWHEMQAQLSECLWLLAVFRTSDDQLESDGHAWTCARR